MMDQTNRILAKCSIGVVQMGQPLRGEAWAEAAQTEQRGEWAQGIRTESEGADLQEEQTRRWEG